MRLYTAADHSVVGAVATTIAHNGGVVTAIDVAESRHDRLTVDVTCSAADAEHSQELVTAVSGVEGVTVHKVSDRTFLLHLGGKISVQSKVPLRTRDDLSMAYTPGVGRVSMAIHDNPEDVRKLTIKGNSVAVVTDGSAVLGLGNIGPGAAMPVMEGKAALFKRFADIDAWPICLASQDTDEIVKAVEMIAPGFGGINLEDIAAPRCFEIEARLRESLDIPVFHDDQHGTAIVVLAALTNALRCVEKQLADVRIVVSGAGAAGTAIVTLLLAAGAHDVVVVDREGALAGGDETLSSAHADLAARPGVDPHDGGQAGRLRPGQPRPGGRPRRGRQVRRGGRVGPLRLPQPDQQRAGLPRRLPRAARRGCHRGDDRHAAARGPGDRRHGQRRGAARRLHHPERLPPRRDQAGGRRHQRARRLTYAGARAASYGLRAG
jgi:hypothetical protein